MRADDLTTIRRIPTASFSLVPLRSPMGQGGSLARVPTSPSSTSATLHVSEPPLPVTCLPPFPSARPRSELLSAGDVMADLAPRALVAQRSLRALAARFPTGRQPSGREAARMPSVREELTRLCRVCDVGTGEAMRGNMQLLACGRWAALGREYARYARDAVRGSASAPLPCFRLAAALIGRALDLRAANGSAGVRACCILPREAGREEGRAGGVRAHVDALGWQPGWTVEDYAARFVLRLMQALYEGPREGEDAADGGGQAVVAWLRDPNVVALGDQVWVLWVMLLRLQLAEQREIWAGLSTFSRLRLRMKRLGA